MSHPCFNVASLSVLALMTGQAAYCTTVLLLALTTSYLVVCAFTGVLSKAVGVTY